MLLRRTRLGVSPSPSPSPSLSPSLLPSSSPSLSPSSSPSLSPSSSPSLSPSPSPSLSLSPSPPLLPSLLIAVSETPGSLTKDILLGHDPTAVLPGGCNSGVSFSGTYGLPLVWSARKPLPCALRSSANPNGVQPAPQSTIPACHVGHAFVLKHHPLGLSLCLSLQWMQPFLFLCSFCLCVLL